MENSAARTPKTIVKDDIASDEISLDEEGTLKVLAATKGMRGLTGQHVPMKAVLEGSGMSDIRFRVAIRKLVKKRYIQTGVLLFSGDEAVDIVSELGYPGGKVPIISLRKAGDDYVLEKGYAQ